MIRHHSSYLLTRTSDYQHMECHPLGIALLEVLATVTELKMLRLEILEDHSASVRPNLYDLEMQQRYA